jgi:hypothetical protein
MSGRNQVAYLRSGIFILTAAAVLELAEYLATALLPVRVQLISRLS